MLFEEYVKTNKAEFLNAVRNVSDLLGINPNWLMAVMWKESGLNHRAVNKNGGATGLIQFMPRTAIGLGTTTERLRNMTNVEQLYYVKKYYEPFVGRLKSYPDLYLATFFPAALGKPDDFVIRSEGLSAETIAKANAVVDLDKNGVITVGEFKAYCYKRLPAGAVVELKKKPSFL